MLIAGWAAGAVTKAVAAATMASPIANARKEIAAVAAYPRLNCRL